MTINTKSSSPLPALAAGSQGFAAKLSAIFFNRSVAIVWWTGLAALMAGFRLASTSGAEGDDMFRAWMIDWAVIWVGLAAISLRLLKPIFDYFVNEQNAHAEASMFRELSKLEPAFAQELRSMEMQQQLRNEQALEDAAARTEALKALGDLSPRAVAKPASAAHLGSNLGSLT
jgi:hypothetical protein